MNAYTPTIGLEIHAELKTNTKMFCDSKNDPDEKRPNVNICPVCMSHPGTLPTINKKAIWHVLRVGKALGGKVSDYTEFERKNYFYPDLPKGYQISQYKFPLISGGNLNGVLVTRVHLEEDTARSMHDQHEHETLVDFNRAGIPLMELVTEPVVKSAKEAGNFARELQLLLRYLEAGDANMEKGEMRVEANISVSKDNIKGTKVEIKNLNSFRVVEKAIEYEIGRQTEVLEGGGKIVQETRGWDEKKEVTFSQRIKEESHDYRYFPDPDLPHLKISEIPEFQNIELPELPQGMRERYKKEYGLKDEDIEIYVRDSVYAQFFEEVVKNLLTDKEAIQFASNIFTTDITALVKSEGGYPKYINDKKVIASFARIAEMRKEGRVSSNTATILAKVILLNGGDAETIAKKRGLMQKSDEGELAAIVEKIIRENEKVVLEYKSGKEQALQFLIGVAMKESKGSANPEILRDLFKQLLTN